MVNYLKNMNIFLRIPFLLFFWVVCVICYIFVSLVSLILIIAGNANVWNVVVATDRLFNSSLGGASTETLSSRSYRGSIAGIMGWCILCKILDKVHTDHCRKSEGI